MSLSCVWPEAHAVAESCLRRASTKRLQFAKIRIVREICKRAFRGGREGGYIISVSRMLAAVACYDSVKEEILFIKGLLKFEYCFRY